jgi:hypothetical protein
VVEIIQGEENDEENQTEVQGLSDLREGEQHSHQNLSLWREAGDKSGGFY